MKVGAPLPKPIPAPRGGPDAVPSRPFADFVADPASRAAGFAELGMFGLAHAQPEARAAVAIAEPAPAAPPDPACAAVTARPIPQRLDLGHGAPAVLSRTDGDHALRTPPPPPATKSSAAASCTLPGEAAVEIEDRTGQRDDPRPARVQPRREARKPQPALAMREEDGVVTLVAGGPPLDPEARSRLRRLVSAILARSGLTLAQFHLNGAPVAPDHLGQGGGTHGPRTG